MEQVDEFYLKCLKASGAELISWCQGAEISNERIVDSFEGENLHRVCEASWPVVTLRFKTQDGKIIDCYIKEPYDELLKLLAS